MAKADRPTSELLLTHGVEEVIEREHLTKALAGKTKLRVKLGIDPTSPDLHIGHAVVLRKLREFQEAGHKAVLIIGDFTARIGDPSGKTKTRPPLSNKEIDKNAKTYLAQAGKIVDIKKAEIRHNSEWLEKGGLAKFLEIARAATVQQLLEREDFKKRMREGEAITALEELYPVLQGYDSVAIKADVELGGTDQLFNLLMGRRVQRHFGMKEQDVLTVPLLIGTDGTQKMSKSLGNYIGVTESPDDMFGKTMAVPDELMPQYFALCTNVTDEEAGRLIRTSPRAAKGRLAWELVRMYHGESAARAARDRWEKLFSKKEVEDSALPELKLKRNTMTSAELALAARAVASKGAAWRLVEQGGISVNGRKVTDPRTPVAFKNGDVVKIGKRHFFRVKLTKG